MNNSEIYDDIITFQREMRKHVRHEDILLVKGDRIIGIEHVEYDENGDRK